MELTATAPAATLRLRRFSFVQKIMDRLATTQGDWHGWTFRNARRSAEARRLIAGRRLPRFSAEVRGCDGGESVMPDFDSRRLGM